MLRIVFNFEPDLAYFGPELAYFEPELAYFEPDLAHFYPELAHFLTCFVVLRVYLVSSWFVPVSVFLVIGAVVV